jgi:hypothetical protein
MVQNIKLGNSSYLFKKERLWDLGIKVEFKP